jgi:hypothetical protein
MISRVICRSTRPEGFRVIRDAFGFLSEFPYNESYLYFPRKLARLSPDASAMWYVAVVVLVLTPEALDR